MSCGLRTIIHLSPLRGVAMLLDTLVVTLMDSLLTLVSPSTTGRAVYLTAFTAAVFIGVAAHTVNTHTEQQQ